MGKNLFNAFDGDKVKTFSHLRVDFVKIGEGFPWEL